MRRHSARKALSSSLLLLRDRLTAAAFTNGSQDQREKG